MKVLLILTILHLVSWAHAGVFPSCHESRLQSMPPSSEVIQVIDDSVHLWTEYDMGNNSLCIKLELPYRKVLNQEEAENLLERSAQWELEEHDFPSISAEDEGDLISELEQDIAWEPDWEGEPPVLLQNDDSPDQGFTEHDFLQNNTMPGNSSFDTSRYVFGQDDRKEVLNTTSFPFNVISYMDYKRGENFYRCTAFMVAPHLALTSGHCVFDAKNGFSKDIRIFPGLTEKNVYRKLTACNADTNLQYAVCLQAGYPGCVNYDYGALFFSPNMTSDAKTYMPLVVTNPKAGTTINIAGYPGQVGGKSRLGQWRASGDVSFTPGNNRLLFNRVDSSSGQSGSPVLISDSSANSQRAIAIHFGWVPLSNQGRASVYNGGVRISNYNKDLLVKWLQDTDPCN